MQGFDAANPPFDRLTPQELEELTAVLDIGYYSPDEVIIREGRASDLLHVVIKGAVEVRDGDALHAVLRAKDSFDSRAVVHGAAGENFVAVEETLCHLIPGSTILSLIRRNGAFAAFFYADVSRKLDAFAELRTVEGVESVLRSRIRGARHGGAVFIDGASTIKQAGQRMRDHDINALFVRDGQQIGVITGMNLSKAVVLRDLPLDTPVREACHFDVISVDADDFVFEFLEAHVVNFAEEAVEDISCRHRAVSMCEAPCAVNDRRKVELVASRLSWLVHAPRWGLKAMPPEPEPVAHAAVLVLSFADSPSKLG